MDSEFPGSIFQHPIAQSYNHRDLTPFDNYRLLKANIDNLKLIQVGLTLSATNDDAYAPDSIALLQRQGIGFTCNAFHGVHSAHFAHLMMSSRSYTIAT
ncbi:hypothetical protein Lal_00005838 [Lupinus albus]|nr:hypothetical protein Lal_00005838 [Lupinus albus]